MNKAILIGRLTKDPELKTTASNISVCNFTLAVDRRFSNAQGQREADFLPIVAWRKTAEFAANYFRKGMRVAVCGSIQTRYWDDDEGKRHYMTEIVADELEFADGKKGSGNDYDGGRRSGAEIPDVQPGGFDEGRTLSKDAFESEGSGTDLPFDY